MEVHETSLPGVLVIEPEIFGDERGFFKETFQSKRYSEIGITLPFVQDNYSRSARGTLRGLHFQKTRPQGKLVSCLAGSVYDVVVDIDRSSGTFGQFFAIQLSEENHKQLWVPPGYAHGFCVLSDSADFYYKCTDFYLPQDEGGLLWDDPDLAIPWPVKTPLLSEKDSRNPRLRDIQYPK